MVAQYHFPLNQIQANNFALFAKLQNRKKCLSAIYFYPLFGNTYSLLQTIKKAGTSNARLFIISTKLSHALKATALKA